MRDFLSKLDAAGLLRHEKCQLESVPDFIKASPTEALIFDVGQKFKISSGYCATKDLIARALECKKQDLLKTIAGSHKGKGKITHLENAPSQQNECSLKDIPIPQLYKGMKPYICAGIVIANDSEYGTNIAFHRMMVAGPKRLVARICQRDTYAYLQKKGELDIAIAIGVHPSLLLAAATSLSRDKNEYEIASKLHSQELAKAKTVDIDIPANAEIIIEGKITNELADEGPFVDITGTMDYVRQQPVIAVKKVTHRDDPIYHQIVPALPEHKLLMGMPREPAIFNAVNSVCDCKNVSLTTGSCCWLHGAVAINKTKETDGKQALKAAFAAHPSMKQCIIVDNDIDITDPEQIEWALATRFQAKKDLTQSESKGSSLDPSAGKDLMTSKLGLDATIPLDKDKKDFLRV